MGVVYRAYDCRRDEIVALKTLRHADPDLLYRLKREFRTLADLSHPNLIVLHELICDGQTWFFTMELLEGRDFVSHVMGISALAAGREWEEPKPLASSLAHQQGLAVAQLARLRRAFGQLAEGLIVLHDAGTLHRDVKPSNIVVTNTGRLVLLDFGLATELQGGINFPTRAHLIGTAAYMAPEAAAGLPLSPAADWYSAGAVLYEALTGRPPFCGPLTVVLMDKQNHDPPPPSEVMPGIPDDLNALCSELLCREPTERPAGRDVLRRLSSHDRGRKLAPATKPARGSLTPFVGRKEHLRVLADALEAVRGGKTVCVSISGPSGQGKSALLERFLSHLPDGDSTVVLQGRCYRQESVPFKALDSVMDNLSRYLSGLSRLQVESLLPRDIAPLIQVFPVIGRVAAVARAPRSDVRIPDQRELRNRAFAAVRELFGRLADRTTLVMSLDDLQWGDRDSSALLLELLKPPQAPALLVLACFRSEGATPSAFAQTIRSLSETAGSLLDRRELTVGPLTPGEAEELTTEALKHEGWANEHHRRVVARESGGIPFFALELVEYLRSSAGDEQRLQSAAEISLNSVLWCRSRELPQDARQLLEVVAVAGQPLETSLACRAAQLGGPGHQAVTVTQSARLLRTVVHADQEALDCCHDRIRETILSRLPQAARCEHHLRLAQTLEASGQADAEMLADHYRSAQRHERARQYYATAADLAFAALAFEHAAGLYRSALELGEVADDQEAVLRTRLGDALASAGRGAEAAGEYLAAADLSREGVIELRRRAAMHLLTSGHIDEGIVLLREVAAAVGIRVPKRPHHAVCSLLISRLRLTFRGFGFREGDVSAIPPLRWLQADVAYSASLGLSLVDAISSADFQSRALLLALRTGDPYRIVRAVAGHAAHMAASGERGRRRAERLIRTQESLVQRLGRPEAIGWLSLSEGVMLSFEGRWEGVLKRCDHAIEVFRSRCTGVAWELNSAHLFSLLALVLLGQIAEFRRRRAILLEAARQHGDLYLLNGLCSSGLIIDRLAADDPEGAERELEDAIGQWTQKGFHIQHHGALFARMLIDLYRGEGRAAWRNVEQSQTGYRHSLQRWVQQLRIGMDHTRAWCALAASSDTEDPKPLLRVAQRAAGRLARERIAYAAAFAHLIRAGVAARAGQDGKALGLLRNAVRRFEVENMQLLAAAARRRLGELVGGDEGRELVRDADAWMHSQTIQNPERMSAMYTPGFAPGL
jgi:serine/threonine protein kinase